MVPSILYSMISECVTYGTGSSRTSGKYCVYVHEDYYTVNQKYCENGCCRDYGEEDEICCFHWSLGVIIGVCLAGIAFIALIAFLLICCYTMKKRGRTGVVSTVPHQPATSTVVYTAAAGYAYPHPPSAFYPNSRFPGAKPPPYTLGQQPAYPPPETNPAFGGPPPPAYGAPPGAPPGPPMENLYNEQKSSDPYGGYGTGINP
ncbi:hypothetical protein ACF0H5_022933 [Mactra antiquata]